MQDVNYLTITIAQCAAGYLETAFGHCGSIAAALRDGPAASARFGLVQTGDHTGHIAFFASYPHMADVQAGWDVVAANAGFRQMAQDGKANVVLRNIVVLDDVGVPIKATSGPGFGVVTRFRSADVTAEEIASVAPIFAENGAQIMRYGTLITGSAAGHRLMAVGYPSLEAVEATYRALYDSEMYLSILAKIDLGFRNIVRFVD